MMMTVDTPETRRGLPVKRPKGERFTYTVERFSRHPDAFKMRIRPDGWGDGAAITVTAYPSLNGDGLDPAEIWHEGRSYYGGCEEPDCKSFASLENFASALRWAVGYARRWNKRHGLTPTTEET